MSHDNAPRSPEPSVDAHQGPPPAVTYEMVQLRQHELQEVKLGKSETPISRLAPQRCKAQISADCDERFHKWFTHAERENIKDLLVKHVDRAAVQQAIEPDVIPRKTLTLFNHEFAFYDLRGSDIAFLLVVDIRKLQDPKVEGKGEAKWEKGVTALIRFVRAVVKGLSSDKDDDEAAAKLLLQERGLRRCQLVGELSDLMEFFPGIWAIEDTDERQDRSTRLLKPFHSADLTNWRSGLRPATHRRRYTTQRLLKSCGSKYERELFAAHHSSWFTLLTWFEYYAQSSSAEVRAYPSGGSMQFTLFRNKVNRSESRNVAVGSEISGQPIELTDVVLDVAGTTQIAARDDEWDTRGATIGQGNLSMLQVKGKSTLTRLIASARLVRNAVWVRQRFEADSVVVMDARGRILGGNEIAPSLTCNHVLESDSGSTVHSHCTDVNTHGTSQPFRSGLTNPAAKLRRSAYESPVDCTGDFQSVGKPKRAIRDGAEVTTLASAPPVRKLRTADGAARGIAVRKIRDKLGMTQEQFAVTFGLSVASLRNWEQGTRVPERPIALYLQLIDKYPEQVKQVVASERVSS